MLGRSSEASLADDAVGRATSGPRLTDVPITREIDVPTRAQVQGSTHIAVVRGANQLIGGRPGFGVAEVIAHLGAVQAQDYLGALWALGVRSSGATEREIEDAVAERAIVRTWPMRGTLHFVPAADARWMVTLLAPRVIRRSAARYRQLELTPPVLARAGAVVERALRDAGRLTRPALYECLERSGVRTTAARGLHVLSHLAHRGVICFGPREGKQPTLVLLEEWVRNPRRLSKEESLAELAHRYFTSHGPATLQDFMWWSGLTITEARAAVEMNESHLRQELVTELPHFQGRRRIPASRSRADAHLLPPFDELLVAYRNREAVVDERFVRRVIAGGMLWPTIVLGSRVVGSWRRQLGRGRVAVHLRPFVPLDASQRSAIEAAAEKYGAFLELPVHLRWSSRS